MSEGQEFLKECKEVRNDFVQIAGQYSVGEHLKLRTEIDTLLIMYDQLCERVRLANNSDENSGLHKHVVNAWRFFKDEMPKAGDEIWIVWEQYPPERRVFREQDILHDWSGMRWMPIPAWR